MFQGHKASGGHDGHGKHGGVQHTAEGHQGGKKWIYHHGFPAKTSNLVIIDRRSDKYSHGPNYYGQCDRRKRGVLLDRISFIRMNESQKKNRNVIGGRYLNTEQKNGLKKIADK